MRSQLLSAYLVQRIAVCEPLARRRRDLERLVLQLVVLDAQRDEADALGLLAAQRLAQQQVVFRLGQSAQQRPHDGGMIAGGDAEPGMAVDDARGLGRDRDVGEQAGHQPGADRRTRASPTRSAWSS